MTVWTAPSIASLKGDNTLPLQKIFKSLSEELGRNSVTLDNNLSLKANIDSPIFTGTPTLPTNTIATTQSTPNNTNAIATTEFVNTSLVNFNSTLSWISFTPSITNITVNNGTLQGQYQEVGNTLFFRVRFTFGTTSAITGSPVLTLPNSRIMAGSPTPIRINAVATFFDASTINVYNGMVLYSSTTTVTPYPQFITGGTYLASNALTAVSPTVPMTWTGVASSGLQDALEIIGNVQFTPQNVIYNSPTTIYDSTPVTYNG